jgi:PAS domain S-box-containing protein
MATPLKLLLVEDSPDDAELMVRELREGGFEVRWDRVQTEADFLAHLNPPPDLIISDYAMPQFTGLKAVELLRQRDLDTPSILVSGSSGEDKAVEAMKRGATDYLLKGRIARLASAAAHALEEQRLRTERRHMQAQLAAQRVALQASEARFAGIINSANDGIITVDREQRIVLFNPAAEKVFGYRAAELLGESLDRLIPSRFRAAHTHHVRKFEETGVTTRRMGALGTICGVRADGTEFPIEASISQVEAGGEKLFTVILRDITARKLGEEARNRLAAIVESSDDAIISESLDGLITSWNTGAEHLYGYSAAEVVGQPITMLIPPDLHEEEPRILDLIQRGERLTQFETVRLRKNGSRLNVSIIVSPIKNTEGKIIGASKIAHDITERKRLEAAVAAAAEEERGRIARDLHDGLGQQLGGALFLTDLLQRDLKKRTAPESERAGQVHALVVEALHQTRELARGLYPVPAEPEGLMTALQNLADRVANDRKMACTFDANSAVLIPDSTITTHLYRIAQEAVNNALKHSGTTRIEIHLNKTAVGLELIVQDFGKGLPAGTPPPGLGMQTMRQRAGLIGAQLLVQTSPPQGTRVTCWLHQPWVAPVAAKTEAQNSH